MLNSVRWHGSCDELFFWGGLDRPHNLLYHKKSGVITRHTHLLFKSSHYLAFHFIDFSIFPLSFIHSFSIISFHIPLLPFRINISKASKLQDFYIVHHHVRRRHQSQQISQTTGSFSAASCPISSLSMPLPCLYILYGRAL